MSDSPRSITAYEQWHGASQQFDYFVAGITGALCAYVAQNLKVQRVGFTPYTLELLSLVVLIASAYFGFRRLEANVIVARQSHSRLEAEERLAALRSGYRGNAVQDQLGRVLQPEQAEELMKRFSRTIDEIGQEQLDWATKSGRYCEHRNWSLFLGFIGLVLSRVLQAYA